MSKPVLSLCDMPHEFEMLLPGATQQWPNATPCRIQPRGDLELNYSVLEKYCLRRLDEVDIDLLIVAGAVAFMDRTVRRRRSSGWQRQLRACVPVHDVERWSSVTVRRALIEALQTLTGDIWEFSFTTRPRDSRALQLTIQPDVGALDVVLPYSGGLDSFAELQRVLVDRPTVRPFLITTGHSNSVSSISKGSVQALHQRCYRVTLPIHPRAGKHAESTGRGRTFLFYCVAAIACKLAGAEAVTVPESGQGALGPSIIPYGNEHPHCSTHPKFTVRLHRFLRTIWGCNAPTFQHPHLWKTKGEVLRYLHERGHLGDFRRTKSCARNLRDKAVSGLPQHCGICTGCILRRLAIAVSLEDWSDQEPYLWSDLRASTLAKSVLAKYHIQTKENDWNIAIHGVLAHQHLADIATEGPNPSSVDQTAFEIDEAIGGGFTETRTSIRGLLARHSAEWKQFVGKLPSSSWLTELIDQR